MNKRKACKISGLKHPVSDNVKSRTSTNARAMNGVLVTQEVCESMNIKLEDLIAKTAIFACEDSVNKIVSQYGNALMYPNLRRKSGKEEKRRTFIGDVCLDDNTYVNRSFKAGFENITFENYTVCHIWAKVKEIDAFSEVRNLALIPSGLHALSDHFPNIIDILKFRAFKLYKWWPKEENCPQTPSYYPADDKWRNRLPFTGFKQRKFIEQDGKPKLVDCKPKLVDCEPKPVDCEHD